MMQDFSFTKQQRIMDALSEIQTLGGSVLLSDYGYEEDELRILKRRLEFILMEVEKL